MLQKLIGYIKNPMNYFEHGRREKEFRSASTRTEGSQKEEKKERKHWMRPRGEFQFLEKWGEKGALRERNLGRSFSKSEC